MIPGSSACRRMVASEASHDALYPERESAEAPACAPRAGGGVAGLSVGQCPRPAHGSHR